MTGPAGSARNGGPTVLADFSVASEPGNVRGVIERVGAVCAGLGLSRTKLEALETAVAEATTNAIEHGNGGDPSLLVEVGVWVSGQALVVRVTDQARGGEAPRDTEDPDIEAKLRGEQSPRGWGLFLIRNLVDDVHVRTDASHHSVELVVRLEGHGVRPASGRS